MATERPNALPRPWDTVLLAVCATLLAASLAAWGTNAYVSIGYAFGTPRESYSPLLRILSVDLTTASPLMFVFTFAFPLLCGRYVQTGKSPPKWLAHGYPAKWSAFIIYVGLGATLFGMILALGTVGLDLTLDQKLSRLIAGTGTALVSSLAALLAVFVANILKECMKAVRFSASGERGRLHFEVEALRTAMSEMREALREAGGGVEARTGEVEATARYLEDAISRVGRSVDRFNQAMNQLRESIDSFDQVSTSIIEARSLLERLETVGQQQLRLTTEQNKRLEDVRAFAEKAATYSQVEHQEAQKARAAAAKSAAVLAEVRHHEGNGDRPRF